MPSVVDFSGVIALKGQYPVLAGLDLCVERGEIVLLRGPNGAGKTSLLRVCSGLLSISSGTASVLGYDLLASNQEMRKHIGFVAHQNHLYSDLWVRDQLSFRARAAGAHDGDIRSICDRMEISERLLQLPTESLSAGQQRRVAIASVALRRPRLWLLDEPHAGLDSEGRDLLDSLLQDAAKAGATIVFASHEINRAETIATRSISILGGQVVGGTNVS
ncbi:MAG: heme ABC exporter ATP-binding protein CcmA [Actinomycetota bacterium]|nr:heme ABC exporter ATP-binding protein CcmA [Actinomycetota bacterium]MDG2121118.1 heme ABC exporter ATP-binding protein CcmA [Actinomycetota bacterium]